MRQVGALSIIISTIETSKLVLVIQRRDGEESARAPYIDSQFRTDNIAPLCKSAGARREEMVSSNSHEEI